MTEHNVVVFAMGVTAAAALPSPPSSIMLLLPLSSKLWCQYVS